MGLVPPRPSVSDTRNIQNMQCCFSAIRTACPCSLTRRSAWFRLRLRFRFVHIVHAVRASEANPRGRMTIDVLIAEPPW